MNCQQSREQFMLSFRNELSLADAQQLNAHLATCNTCRLEFEEEKRIWEMLGNSQVPEPSAGMKDRFYGMLNGFIESEHTKRNSFSFFRNISQLWSIHPRLQLAYSFCLLLAGLGLGYLFYHGNSNDGNKQELAQLSSQMREMQQMMMLSLLENPSATERIRGVSYTDNMHKVDSQVVNALLTTLNNDPNVNVRLATLEALVKFSDHPKVRMGLIQSIAYQDSPILQTAIADVMVRLQEKKSVRSLQELLRKEDLNDMVKEKIQQSINKLI